MRIPSFRWADGTEVWNCMLEKDATYSKLKSERVLERHPSLVHSYRTILFDWLSEVSHECKFHRETYHLALDFIDRYLAATSNVGKYQLQLIGTTCLFLAAKYEEIRPPTVIEFAELTDGACKAEDIIDHEVVILSAINWDITPMTPNSWLNIYMQILFNPDQAADATNIKPTSDKSLLAARNCLHKRIASVIDLAILHIDSLRFKNSILAAAAVYSFTTEQCSRYSYQELAECIRWLKPFVEVAREIEEPVFMATCKGAHPTQMHAHIATATLLEQVLVRMTAAGALRLQEQSQSVKRKAYCLEDSEDEMASMGQQKPEVQVLPSSTVLLTPPSSTSKVRKQLKRNHSENPQSRCQAGDEFSPPLPLPLPLSLPLRQPLHQHPLQQQSQQQQQPKAHTQKISV